jgi:fructose-bisphosphate aldolase class II
VPVLIGTSEGERVFIGARQAAAVVRSIHDEYDFPIFLNGDHTHSLAKAEEAARAGYDMIGFDGSTLAFEENVRQTKQAVEAIKSINADIVVEGELGYIGSGSEIHDTVPELIFTKPDEARLTRRLRSAERRVSRWIYSPAAEAATPGEAITEYGVAGVTGVT